MFKCMLIDWIIRYKLLISPFIIYTASEHPFKGILTSVPKPGGGEFGKFYSLPALNDPRIGMCICFMLLSFYDSLNAPTFYF